MLSVFTACYFWFFLFRFRLCLSPHNTDSYQSILKCYQNQFSGFLGFKGFFFFENFSVLMFKSTDFEEHDFEVQNQDRRTSKVT